jgi:hypothetical protein
VLGRAVFKVVVFKPLAPYRYGFKSRQDRWIIACEEAIQLAFRTSVAILRCLFVPAVIHGRALEAFPHQ